MRRTRGKIFFRHISSEDRRLQQEILLQSTDQICCIVGGALGLEFVDSLL